MDRLTDLKVVTMITEIQEMDVQMFAKKSLMEFVLGKELIHVLFVEMDQ